jgi:hypothetical protein
VQTTPQQVKLDQAELAAQAWLASKALAAAAVAAQAEARQNLIDAFEAAGLDRFAGALVGERTDREFDNRVAATRLTIDQLLAVSDIKITAAKWDAARTVRIVSDADEAAIVGLKPVTFVKAA